MKPLAIGYRVVIELDSVEEKTAGGIILTQQRKESDEVCCTIGTVVDIGPFAFWGDDGKQGWPEKWYNIGDRVIFAEHSGRYWEDKDSGLNYRIMNDKDVIAKVVE